MVSSGHLLWIRSIQCLVNGQSVVEAACTVVEQRDVFRGRAANNDVTKIDVTFLCLENMKTTEWKSDMNRTGKILKLLLMLFPKGMVTAQKIQNQELNGLIDQFPYNIWITGDVIWKCLTHRISIYQIPQYLVQYKSRQRYGQTDWGTTRWIGRPKADRPSWLKVCGQTDRQIHGQTDRETTRYTDLKQDDLIILSSGIKKYN